jgi:hypothetical protein
METEWPYDDLTKVQEKGRPSFVGVVSPKHPIRNQEFSKTARESPNRKLSVKLGGKLRKTSTMKRGPKPSIH